MKAYFIRLFNYDRYANEITLEAMINGGWPEKPVQLMAHLLAAQQVWLNRCMNLPQSAAQLWPALGQKSDGLADIIDANHKTWINHLNELTDMDFERIISYKRTTGERFENRLDDILAHVINHGTHHRAQIGQLLKLQSAVTLPVTDYIFYLR